MNSYDRISVPRGLLAATAAALTLAWTVFALDPGAWPGITAPVVQSALLLANLALTAASRRYKVTIVRAVQRWAINPTVRALLCVGLNPLGLVLLQTRGRVSGLPRRTPVGNGVDGTTLWIVAEHGARAGYVRNLQSDPAVRVRVRRGWRYRWVDGIATVLPEDDALARQRRIVRWHPLRAVNAMSVRVLGADLLTVRVDLLLGDGGRRGRIRGSDHDTAGPQSAEPGARVRDHAARV